MTYSEKYDAAQSAVVDMLSSLSARNGSADYTLGYLESMLTSWAADNETVFEEVVKTTDWLNAKESQNA
ncbi:hypothetical protein N9H77_01515 [Porticoccaceae bacterium]|nr:hypothetical protein [Porticoccaceae bacterium]